jgi:hypothetical protein
MAEAPASEPPDPGPALDRIEAAVQGGNSDLRALGFWPIVARVKPDPMLVDRYADQIGRIDTKAFRAGVRLRAPVWLGNALLLAGVAVGLSAAIAATRSTSTGPAGALLLGSGVILSVVVHCPAHWVVGRSVNIRFTDYFLGGPSPPRPGLKTDYATYLRADPSSRAWMHASGAIATKLAPFVALAFWPASDAPWWSAAGLIAVGLVQIATDVTLSVKVSDWKRFSRERAVARVRTRVRSDER